MGAVGKRSTEQIHQQTASDSLEAGTLGKKENKKEKQAQPYNQHRDPLDKEDKVRRKKNSHIQMSRYRCALAEPTPYRTERR